MESKAPYLHDTHPVTAQPTPITKISLLYRTQGDSTPPLFQPRESSRLSRGALLSYEQTKWRAFRLGSGFQTRQGAREKQASERYCAVDKKDMRYGYAGSRMPVTPSSMVVCFRNAVRRVGSALPLPRRKGVAWAEWDATSWRGCKSISESGDQKMV